MNKKNRGGYATISINLYNGPPRLLTDVDSVIQENKVKISNVISKQKEIKDEIQKCISLNANHISKKKGILVSININK